MSDENGVSPIYTVGEETDEMMEASVAAVIKAASGGLAAVGIRLGVGVEVEAFKWGITVGVKGFD